MPFFIWSYGKNGFLSRKHEIWKTRNFAYFFFVFPYFRAFVNNIFLLPEDWNDIIVDCGFLEWI